MDEIFNKIFELFDESIHPIAAVFRYLGYAFALFLLPRTVNFLMVCAAAPFRKVNLRAKKDAYAIITGASDGLGAKWARELAGRGFNLLLLSRTESKLAKIQAELQKKYEIDVQYLSVNFSRIDIYDEIIARIEALPFKIGVLVNNVGMARHAQVTNGFTEFDDDMNRQQLICNTYPVTRLCEIVLSIMERQKSGVVINVSSSTDVFKIPYFSVYCATKAYVSTLTECLAEEYFWSPIRFLHLTPAHMRTNFHAHTRDYDLLSGSFMVVDPRPYVRAALRAVGVQLHSDGHWKHTVCNGIGRFGLMIFPICDFLAVFSVLAKRFRTICRKLNAKAKENTL